MNIDTSSIRGCSSLLIAFGISAGLLVACESNPRSRPAIKPDVVDVLHTDSTAHQDTNPGMIMAFDLPGHAGTGYAWRPFGATPSFLELVGDPVFTAANPDRMGSSGMTRFLVKATGTGKVTLVFEYVRSWEEDAAPVRTARVEIESNESE